MADKIISIIIPVYNEEENINLLYDRISKVMDGLSYKYEMLFINDGSTDDTVILLSALNKQNKKVKIINLSRNFGKENAMSAGIDHAAGDAAVIIDSDLQDPPEVIPELIKEWEKGYDAVYAVRKKRNSEGLRKKVTAYLFYKIFNKFSKIKIPANTGDFRIIDKAVILALRELPEYNRFMKGLFSWVGFKQTGIYYNRDPRYAGRTKWSYGKLLDFAVEGLTSFSYLPLKMASYLGILVSFLSFSYAIFIFIRTIIFSNPVPGYPSLTVIILFLSGIQLFTIGIIGEYIGRTYYESKRRKPYFIKDKIGFKKK
jgi:polyisoprenyl-phosphate glycosyltransferase